MSTFRVSRQAELAIGMMVHLAKAGDVNMRTEIVAEAVDISTAHAAKIINVLSNAHLIDARRGRYGGLALARPADRISLWEVIDAITSNLVRKETDWKETPISADLEDIQKLAAIEVSAIYASYSISDLVTPRARAQERSTPLGNVCAQVGCPRALMHPGTRLAH